MLSTIWTWTQEWSDIPSRSDWTWAMCHQARTSGSALTPSSSASSRRLPRVGARTWAASIASPGVRPSSPGPAGVSPAAGSSGLGWTRPRAQHRRRSRAISRPDAGCRFFRPPRLYARTVASSGAGKPKCPDTGLAVPECSCRRCLEAMLREFRPALLAEEISVTRFAETGSRRRATRPRSTPLRVPRRVACETRRAA